MKICKKSIIYRCCTGRSGYQSARQNRGWNTSPPSHKSPLQGAVWLFIMQRGGREVLYCSREFTVVAVPEEKSLETLLSADFTVVPCFTLVKTKGFNSCVLLLSDGLPPFTS